MLYLFSKMDWELTTNKIVQQSKLLKLFQDLLDAQNIERHDVNIKIEALKEQFNYLNYLFVTTSNNGPADGEKSKYAYEFVEAKGNNFINN